MEEKKYFAHETALIDEGCDIGEEPRYGTFPT